jgi:hypothetical protein
MTEVVSPSSLFGGPAGARGSLDSASAQSALERGTQPNRPGIFSGRRAHRLGQSRPLAPCVSYLNPNAVVTPRLGTHGNMGISTARAPGFWEWDQAITHQFPIREAMRIELRAEGFNLTNSVRLGAPKRDAERHLRPDEHTTDQPTTGAGTGVSPGSGGRILQFTL